MMPTTTLLLSLRLSLLGFLASLFFASLASAQSDSWSPYRVYDKSENAIQRRVQDKRVRLPAPVRLTQYAESAQQNVGQSPLGQIPTEQTPIERAPIGQTDAGLEKGSATPPESSIESTDFSSGTYPPGSMHEFGTAAMPVYPIHTVIRSPHAEMQKQPHPQFNYHSQLNHHSQLDHSVNDPSASQQSVNQQAGNQFFHSFYGEPGQSEIPALQGDHHRFSIKKYLPGPIQPSQATIPDARERATWKQPYSYGYFGASGNPHWGKHHGYRDKYTEFRYR